MAFHILSNGKGQINIEFVVSVIILALVTISAAIAIVRLLPGVSTSAEETHLRSRATDLAKVLFEEPGIPVNWTANPVLIGLAEANNFSNETVKGSLDPIKVSYLNNSILYSQLKSNLNLETDLDFHITIQNETTKFLDYFNFTPSSTDKVVTIKKLASLNKSAVNITLLVWT